MRIMHLTEQIGWDGEELGLAVDLGSLSCCDRQSDATLAIVSLLLDYDDQAYSILSFSRGWDNVMISSGAPVPLNDGVSGTRTWGLGLGGSSIEAGSTAGVLTSSTAIASAEPVFGSEGVGAISVIVDDDGSSLGTFGGGADS